MADKRIISVDEFLALKSHPAFSVAVESVDAEHVKLTVRTAQGICDCGSALVVPKSAIRGLAPTGEMVPCCGKLLPLATIEFTPETAGVLNSILGRKAAEMMHAESLPQSFRPRPDDERPPCPRGERLRCRYDNGERECWCETISTDDSEDRAYFDQDTCFNYCSENLARCLRIGPGKRVCYRENEACLKRCSRAK
jgi:hypothetical protein